MRDLAKFWHTVILRDNANDKLLEATPRSCIAEKNCRFVYFVTAYNVWRAKDIVNGVGRLGIPEWRAPECGNTRGTEQTLLGVHHRGLSRF